MINRIFRPVVEGFKGVVRHGAMAFSSIMSVLITLSIISFFIIFVSNVSRFTKGVEQSVNISVLIDYNYESVQQEDKLSLEIQSISAVEEVHYSNKEDEFKYYLESFSDEKTRQAFEPFKDDNPMHDAFYVTVRSGTELEAVARQISALEGVYRVNYGGTSALQIITILRSIRYSGFVLSLVLSLLAVSLIQNTIKLTITARSDEIQIMRNVGAKDGFIRMPFVFEGIIIGILGSIIPIVMTIFGYIYAYRFTKGYIISTMFPLLPPQPFLVYLSLALLLIGIFVGWLGSFFSVTRHIRWKR